MNLRIFWAGLLVLFVLACASATPEPHDGGANERSTLTAEACEQQGGTVVGDIGDGAIHRPDYRCPSGEPPLGTIQAVEGEPIAVEGSICCR